MSRGFHLKCNENVISCNLWFFEIIKPYKKPLDVGGLISIRLSRDF
ncbi:MAG: hypothetical protein ACTSRA_01670 [Promethearchaeota archaeon]